MPIFNNALAGASGAGAGDYEIERSLRFNSGDSAHLSRTPSSAGNRKTWTWSGWVKRSKLGAFQAIFGLRPASTPWNVLYFRDSDVLQWDTNTSFGSFTTTQVFRDPSAWYHIVLAFDTTAATGSDRVKFYINGTQVENFSASTTPSQNQEGAINTTVQHNIGAQGPPTYGDYFNGYLADVHFIDGQALAATDFGAPDNNGVWQPKKFAGSYTLPASGVVYSSYVTGTPYSSLYTADQAFDGNADTSNMSLAAGGATMTFTPPNAIAVSSSLRIWGAHAGSGGDLTINGTSVGSQIASTYQWNTITGITSITSIAWSSVNGNSAFLVGAIEVDGTVLVDGTAAQGANSFHLDFKDNSSSAALGNDAAGSNNWTVNNIVGPPVDYVTGRFTGTERSGFEWVNLFNGSKTQGAVPSANGNFVWTPASSIAFTTLAVYAYKDSSPGGLEINGTSVISQIPNHGGVGSNQRTVITGISSPLTSLKNISLGNLANVVIAGIEIDGVLLQNAETDCFVDTPTNAAEPTDTGVGNEVVGNYCTMNPLDNGGLTLANGNLDVTMSTSAWRNCRATTGMTSGKWYFEVECKAATSGQGLMPGILNAAGSITTTVGANSGGYAYNAAGGNKYNNNVGSSYGATFDNGDIIGVAYDGDNGTITFYKNGASQGVAFTSIPSGTYFPAVAMTGTMSASINFGQRSFAHPLSSNPTYSQSVSGAVAGSPYDATKMFDGKLTTYTDHTAQNSTITWTYTLTSVTSLRVYIHQGNSTGTVTTVGGNGTQTDTISANFGPGWHTISLSSTGSTINSIAFTRGGSGNPLEIYAIEVNGTVLVEGAGAIYKSLNTANLPTPTIADGSQYFDTKLYTGNDGTQTISGFSFAPDWVWIKSRSSASAHCTADIVVGANKHLLPNETLAEATGLVPAFTSDGFTVNNLRNGADNGTTNDNNLSYVSWAWDAGSSNTTIAAGSLNSSTYNQSQTWSNGTQSGNAPYGSTSWDNVFDGVIPSSFDQSKLVYQVASGGVFTFSSAVSGRIQVYSALGSAGYNSGNTIVLSDGTSQEVTNGNSSFVLYDFGTKSNITSITLNGAGNSSGLGVPGILLDGKLLVDAGVTPPNVPSIASTVRANPSAGFSIVKYQADAPNNTISHKLNAVPELVIIKSTTRTDNWIVYHSAIGLTGWLHLNAAHATTNASIWGTSGNWTSNTFGVSTSAIEGNNYGSNDFIAYCFAPIEGYSAAFSWSGNGTDQGSFIYLGFRPKFVIMKDINASNNWQMLDAARDPYNVTVARLFPNQSVTENSATSNFDFLSNGLKARNQYTTSLANTNFIGFAFAEHPFKTARAR